MSKMKSLSLSLLFAVANCGVLDDFQCFDDPKTIYYENDGEQEVTNLPQIRVMMCGYSSQCALNMVAYLFMKEKLGLDVTLYPTDDYSAIWDGSLYWNDWKDNAYPRNYFSWLADDVMDLNFEFWPLQYVAYNSDKSVKFDFKNEYVLPGKVDFGGFVGAYGEISVYVPTYWAEEHPTHVIPFVIANDTEYREALMAGSSQGTTDWVAKYLSDRNGSQGFDTPAYDKPIIWGSVDSYLMSAYAFGLKDNVIDGGLDVLFVSTNSESKLMDIVSDLYSQRAAFLANIYTIDDNFGAVDAATGALQQFEKVAFPRNPDQSTYDPCYMAKECQNPVEPIMKAANPLLKARLPEAYQFFNGFTMGTRQINKIVSYYLEVIDDQSMDSTTKWLHAACQWLNSSDEAALHILCIYFFQFVCACRCTLT